MSPIQPTEPAADDALPLRPFGLGFRPFFLLAGIGAVALMLAWLGFWHRGFTPEHYYGRIGWHSHEMLFGYVTAVIAGFLLTAVRNWTGRPTPSGLPLALLALLWLGGRLLPWLPGLPGALIAGVELAFLPLLAAGLARPLWAGKNRVNRLFLPLLLAMAAANAIVHARALGWNAAPALDGIGLMLALTLLLLVFVAGRIMPFFTEVAVAGAKPVNRPWVERAGFALLIVLALLALLGLHGPLTAAVALAIGALQAVRLAGWHHPGVWRIPILWVLFTGYGWLTAGFLLLGLSELGMLPRTLAVHALTAGGFGVFTLGMMARVALGHTGRPMQPQRAIGAAFVVANLAAAVRVAGPWAVASWSVSWIMLAGLLWSVAFALFAVVYAPILLRARVDGRPD